MTDLTAARNGNIVTLHWTMPKRTTDRLLIASEIKGPVSVRVCRREGAASACDTAGEVAFLPGVEGEFHETLQSELSSGEPRALLYFVELMNKAGQAGNSGGKAAGRSAGRSAGLSNSAVVAAGAPPGPISNLTAEVRADGIALRWDGGEETAVRLHRKLLTPTALKANAPKGLMKPSTELALQDFLVDAQPANQALDSSIRYAEIYEYTAQAVKRVTVDGKTLELDGDISLPIRIKAIDSFPPTAPRDLVAVFVPEDKTIDLSWAPNSDEDLAGYIIYRSANGLEWTRISGAQPLIGPAFRDSSIEGGHSYRYAVTAIDLTGHESKRSAEALESVPEAGPNP